MTAVLSGCGSKSQAPSGEEEPVSSAPKEVTDAKSLAETLQYYMGSENTFYLYGDGEITATVTTDGGECPVEASIYYMDYILPTGEASQSLSMNISSDRASTSSSDDAYVIEEDGKLFTYMENGDYDWDKYEGDYLKDHHYVSDVFQSIADGNVEAAYTAGTEEEEHSLTFTLSGDALRYMMMQYCCGMVYESSPVNWDGVTAEVQVDARIYEYSLPNIEIQVTGSDLAEALLLSAGGIQSVESPDFHMEISCSFYEDYTLELEDEAVDAEESGDDMSAPYDLTHAFEYWVSADQDAAYAANFEEIETTDPVTLYSNGVSVTISFPWELWDYSEFSQTSPDAVIVRQDSFGGRTLFRIDGRTSKSILSDEENFYEDKKGDSQYQNVEISGVYQVDTENGQADVLRCECETVNGFGVLCHDVNYYAVLPLENGMNLYLEASEVYHPEEGDSPALQDDIIIGLFNHCGIGGEAPSIADARCSSLEEYLENPERQEEIEMLRQAFESDALSAEYTVDGNRLIYTLTISEPPAGMEVDMDKAKTSMEMLFLSNSSALNGAVRLLQKGIAGDDPKIVIIVNTSDGREVFSETYEG